MAFDEVVGIVRRHTTPSHRWRALARALKACRRLAQNPPPICRFIKDASDEGGGAVRVRGPAWVPRPLGACSLASALGILPGFALAFFAGRFPFSCWRFSAITRENSSGWRPYEGFAVRKCTLLLRFCTAENPHRLVFFEGTWQAYYSMLCSFESALCCPCVQNLTSAACS